MPNHKFKLGDFVKHRASDSMLPVKLLVISVGEMTDSTSTVNMYLVSYQKGNLWPSSGDGFNRGYLLEDELEIFPDTSFDIK